MRVNLGLDSRLKSSFLLTNKSNGLSFYVELNSGASVNTAFDILPLFSLSAQTKLISLIRKSLLKFWAGNVAVTCLIVSSLLVCKLIGKVIVPDRSSSTPFEFVKR